MYNLSLVSEGALRETLKLLISLVISNPLVNGEGDDMSKEKRSLIGRLCSEEAQVSHLIPPMLDARPRDIAALGDALTDSKMVFSFVSKNFSLYCCVASKT